MNGHPAENVPTDTVQLEIREFDCSLCGSGEQVVLYEATIDPYAPFQAADFDCTNPGHGEHYRIVRCAECGMVFCSPRPTVESIIAAYAAVEDTTYIGEEAGRHRTFRDALARIARDGAGQRLLDVGCLTGVFLEEARKVGFSCFGLEPSAYAAERARHEKGFAVHCGAAPCVLPWQEKFDVVTMWDVIEHVDDPLRVLTFLHSVLKPGGHLHLSTMDLGSLYARIVGHSWPWFMRMHIQYFTKKTMKAMLLKAGFREVKFYTYSHTVHVDYLYKKLEELTLPLRLVGRVGGFLLKDAEGFVRVRLGDMMHVEALA